MYVAQSNVDDAGFYNFFLWNLQCFCLGLTCVFHTFNNDIIKVLGAYCIGICIVEAGSYGCKTFHIVFVVQRIEYQIVVELLEQGEISREEYDQWRYKYPELDTSKHWAKVPSQAVSDMLMEEFQKIEKEEKKTAKKKKQK